MMITTCILLVSSLQIDSENWAIGFFGIVGEMTYSEAADAIGASLPKSKNFTDLVLQLRKDPTNVVIWKAASDQCVTQERWSEFYRLCADYTGGKVNLQNGKSWEISNAVGYSLLSFNRHFDENGNSISEDLRPKWRRLLSARMGILGGIRSKKPEILVQLTSHRGSPKAWRELIANYEGKIGCPYYLQYSRAESYMFGEIPADQRGKPVGAGTPMDISKCISEYRKACLLFPSKPTPYYKLASLLWDTDRESAKEFARKYLKFENRPFKSRWVQKMKDFVR